MSVIDKLSYTTDVDMGGFSAGIAKMISQADRISREIQGKLTSIKPASDMIGASFGGMAKHALAIAPALAAAAVAFKGVEFIKDGVVAASDLNETIGKSKAVLGDASGAAEAFAGEMASKYGLVKREVLETTAGLGGLGKSLGKLSGGALSDFGIKFTRIAADLSSINNIDLKDAADALRVGLSGNQSDRLKELGIITTEVAVKEYALAKGIARVGAELTEQEKFAARAGLIAEGLSFANGNLEQTSDDVANAYRKFTGTLTNLGAEFGSTLLPAVKSGIGVLNEFASAGMKAFGDNKGAAADWAAGLKESFDVAGTLVRNWELAMEIVELNVGQIINNIGADFEALATDIASIPAHVAKVAKFMAGLGPDPGAFKFAKPKRIDLSKEIEALQIRMGDKEGKRANDAFKPPAGVPPAPAVADPDAAAREKLANWIDSLTESAMNPWEKYNEGVKKLQEALRTNLIDQDKFNKLSRQLLVDSPLGKFVERFRESTRTPLDRLKASLAQGIEAFHTGLIGPGELAKVGTFAMKEAGIDPAAGKIDPKALEPKHAGAFSADSSEGYSAILRSLDGRGNQMQETAKANRDTAKNTREMAFELAKFNRMALQEMARKPAIFRF